MTNAIIMSVMLSTNWNITVELAPTKDSGRYHNVIHRAEVYRCVAFHTMEGTNRVLCGHSHFVKAGTISKTNDVLGPIVWDKP